MKKYTRQHPENPDLFWCPKCQTYKPREAFNKGGGPWKLATPCKVCRFPQNKKKICELCGREISVITMKRKYCHQCKRIKKREWNKIGYSRHRRERLDYAHDQWESKKKIHQIKCAQCGNTFESYRDKKYCSRICIKKAWEDKNKDIMAIKIADRNKKSVESLSNHYIKRQLAKMGILNQRPEVMEIKRQQILLHRSITKLSEVANGFDKRKNYTV